MFGTLNAKLEKIVKSISGKAIISENDLDITLREIRIAFLEADVALSVVKNFIENIRSKIIGEEVLKSIKPDQMIIKLVQEELISILGSNNEPLNIANNGLTKILFFYQKRIVLQVLIPPGNFGTIGTSYMTIMI